MKAEARVIPVCPKCGENIEWREIAVGGEGTGLCMWVCGCEPALAKEFVGRVVESFIAQAPMIYAGAETMEDLLGSDSRDLYDEVLNAVEGVRDFRDWLLSPDCLEANLERREEMRAEVDRRRKVR